MIKEEVIFVGSFLPESQSGGLGGQMFACKSLIESELSNKISWLKIDSTAETNLHRPFIKRAVSAIYRLLTLVKMLISHKQVKKVLIFTSNGMSFVEKGVMALISSYIFGKNVVLAPRSGRITNDLQINFKRAFVKRVFLSCEFVICQGEFWQELFESTFPTVDSVKYVVIKNWIKSESVESSNLLKVSKMKGQILFLGWLEKDKGIFDLIKVAKKLQTNKIAFKLIIGGDGVEKDRVSEEILFNQLKNHVETIGWVKGDIKKKLLGSSEIFVLPSYFEGMPNALIEAMSHGLPCVATKVGAIPNLITHGHDGLLVDAGNVEMLYDSILRLIEDGGLRRSIGSEAKESIKKNHAITSVIPKFKKILLNETNYTRP